MSSFRKFNRQNKLQKNIWNNKLSLSVAAFATALGFFCPAAEVIAQNIVRDDGQSFNTGNLHEIYAQEKTGDNAMNWFKSFELDQNHIANMYFRTSKTDSDAANLVNFVESRVNINGTVNAIQNNKIGGNLFFLFEDGLVVGKTGVINAGTFSAMPHNNMWIDKATKKKHLNEYLALDTNVMDLGGTIDVYGQINTVNGIRLKAGRAVNIGGKVNDELVKAALRSGVVDFSNVVNTNGSSGLSGVQLKAERLTNGDIVLGQSQLAAGNIELTAEATHANFKDVSFTPIAESIPDGNNAVRTEVNIGAGSSVQAFGDIRLTATSTNGSGQEGLLFGDINIDSLNVSDLFGQMAKTEAFITVGEGAKLQAGFDVAQNKYVPASTVTNADGSEYNAPTIIAKAITQNTYLDNTLKNPINWAAQGLGALLLRQMIGDKRLSGSIVNLENESSVSIGKNAVLEAAGDVQLTASNTIMSVAGAASEVSNLKANAAVQVAKKEEAEKKAAGDAVKAATDSGKLKAFKEALNKFMPGAAIAYNSTESTATINIAEGAQLTSKQGDVMLNAKIDGTNITSAAVKDATKKPENGETQAQNNGIKLGVAISDLHDNATINVKKNAKITAEQGSVNIAAKVEDRMKLVASAINSNTKLDTDKTVAGEASTALGLSFVDNSSHVNIEGEITAGKNIAVTGETKTSLTMAVNNAVKYTVLPDGTDMVSAGEAMEITKEDAEKMVGEVNKELEKKVDNAAEGAAKNTGDSKDMKKNAKALIALGASVGAVDSDLTSEVNIASTAKLKAGNVLNIASGSKYDSSVGDLNLAVSGATAAVPSDKAASDAKTAAVNASVLVGVLKNDATVNIADGSQEQHAELNAQAIKLTSDTATQWDRINGSAENINNELNKLGKNLTALLGDDSIGAAFVDAVETLITYPSEQNMDKLIEAETELLEKINASNLNSAVTLVKKNVSDVLGAVKAFLNVTNYANFSVGSSVNDKTGATDVGISGSVLVTDLQNKSKINIGRFADVKATQGNLDLNAKNDTLTVSVVGAIAAYDVNGYISASDKSKNKKNAWNHLPKKFRDYLSASWGDWKVNIIPQFNVSGSEYGIGGNLNISNDKNSVGIFVGKGAQLSAAKELTLNAENMDGNAALVFGGAMASKTGITGMGSYIYGGNDISVDVDDETKLTAAELNLRAQNEEYINSFVFGFTSAEEQAVGAAVNIIDFNSKATAKIADNDEDEDSLAGETNAEAISVSAENSGVNNAASIAGSSVSQKQAADSAAHDKKGQVEVKDRERLNSLSLSGAGSLSLVLGETTTESYIAGNKLKIHGNGSKDFAISAKDSKYNGAYSGSMALQFLGLEAGQQKKALDGSLSGSVAAVDNKNIVRTGITGAEIADYRTLAIRAQKEGTAVAAGLALGVQSVQKKDGAAQLVVSGSGVGTENDVRTDLDGAKISNVGMVKNIAQNKDVQVAGGITVSAAKNSSVGLGGAVSVLNATNKLYALMDKNIISAGSVENLAVAKTTQVSGAVTVGVLTGLDTAVNANGALSVNILNNDVQSAVDASEITADYFAVRAYDGNLQERASDGTTKTDTTENAYLHDDSDAAYITSLVSQGLNVDGKTALDNINSEVVNVTVAKDKLNDASMGHDAEGNMSITATADNKTPYAEGEALKTDGAGSLIISSAVAVSVDAGSEKSYANIGAANVDNVLSNNFAAKISGSKINKNSTKAGQTVSVDAASNTEIIGVAMGVEAGQKSTVGAGGSVTVQTLNNNTTATVENTTGIADKLNITAQNSGLLVNVAGAGAGAANQTVAAGLTVATNVLHNTTGAYARGVNFAAQNNSTLDAGITAANKSADYGFAVGVAAVTGSAALLNGATAVNKGTDNVEAIVDSYDDDNGNKKDNSFANVGKLNVAATDKTVKTAVAGGVEVSVSTSKRNYAALGGAVAYNEIGDFTGDDKLAEKEQHLRAYLNNAQISMKQGAKDKAVSVAADSDATLVTVAGGVGVSVGSLVSGQGAAATALVNTATEALMQDSRITDAEKAAAVSVNARSESDIITTADALNITIPKLDGINIGLSTAVGVNRITSKNSAQIMSTSAESKALQAGSLAVKAENEQEIINAGIAATGEGFGANISVNKITADNTANISNMDIAAAQSALVNAKDKRSIRNYTGSFVISASNNIAVGGNASVAVNEIDGATLAQVKDSNIKAQGLTVNADSENKLQSVVINVGAGGASAFGMHMYGDVNVNSIGGSTQAVMSNSDYNKDSADGLHALAVTANDKADVLGIVGSLSVAASPSAAVGLGAASDTTLLNRATVAQVIGNTASKNTINASSVNVAANSKQNTASWAVGIGASIGLIGAGGLNGAVGVVENTALTQADMENISGVIDAASVTAEHESDISRYALAASIEGGEFGGTVGVGVGVLHDDSKTVANLNNNNLWGSAANKQKVNLAAQNKTLLNSFIGTLSVAISIGGAASGNGSNENYTNYVAANARGNTLGNENNIGAEFTATAKNIIDNGGAGSESIGSQMGMATVGAGIGAVGVILNNIDTSTYTNIENNTIYADSIDVKAEEKRKIKNAVYNNGLSFGGAGVSVILTDIGTKTEGFTYDAGNNMTANVDVERIIGNLNSSLSEQGEVLDDSDTQDYLRLAGIDSSKVTTKTSVNAASKIEGKAPAGVHAVVKNSKLYAGKNINVSADAQTNLEALNQQGTITAIAVNVAVSKANIKQNVGTEITDSTLSGYKIADAKFAKPVISLGSTLGGSLSNQAWQGGFAGASLSTAYAGSWAINENNLNVTNSTLSGSRLELTAKDTTSNDVRVYGATLGGYVGGALLATAISAGTNNLKLDKATLTALADGTSDSGDILLTAERANKVNAESWGGALGALSAAGVFATAVDGDDNGERTSDSTLSITSSTIVADKNINAAAQKLLDVTALTRALNVNLVQANGSQNKAVATGTAHLTSGSGNSFSAGENISLASRIDKRDGAAYGLTSDMESDSGAGVGVQVSESRLIYDVSAVTDAEAAKYTAKKLSLQAENNPAIYNRAKNVEVGALVASGTIEDYTKVNAKAVVNAKGMLTDSSLGSADINSRTNTTETIYVSGNGGGLLDISPVAAKSVNRLYTDAQTNILGSWNLGNLSASVVNTDNLQGDVYSLKVGGIVGYGGVKNYNVVQHKANVNVGDNTKDTQIITTGDQLYQAANKLQHKFKSDADAGGLIYASLGTLGTTYDGENSSFAAQVNFNKAQLTAAKAKGQDVAGKIQAQAYTQGALTYENSITDGGFYSGVFNDSYHNFTYDNAINANGSTITTQGQNDITLASWDNTDLMLNTYSNSNGFAASAYAHTNLDLVRNNKINIKNTKLESYHDVQLYAGRDLWGATSELDLWAIAEAYNHSFIAAGTSPQVYINTFAQNNKVDIAADSNIESVHDVYLDAVGGTMNLKKIANRYTIWSGNTTSEPTKEERATAEAKDNNVTVNGTIVAGTHSGLNLKIEGNADFEEIKDEKGTVTGVNIKTDNVKISTADGQEWFDTTAVSKDGVVRFDNPLLARYQEIYDSLAGYATDSQEYKSLTQELKSIVENMLALGFAKQNPNNTQQQLIVLPYIEMPAIQLPDILVSGGSIYVTSDADKINGKGSLTAKGVHDLEIASSSNMNLIVNDVAITEAGGKLLLNNAIVEKGKNFDGEATSDSSSNTSPKITISSTGNNNHPDLHDEKYSDTNIIVVGKVKNISGEVEIKNTHSDINISGDAEISASSIKIIADAGSVTQTTDGLATIGSDPIARYQFNDTIAKKIEQYIADLIAQNRISEFTAGSYEEYCNYLIAHKSAIGLDDADVALIKSKLDEYKQVLAGTLDDGRGIIAGKNIYITARNINVDGLVQSGYALYKADFTDAMAQKMQELDNKYGASNLLDSDVLGNDLYLLNTGGAVYNAQTHRYDYEIRLYYNPATKTILSDSVETGGGQIYLNGAISSTGAGRILAMNGAADVNIDLSKASEANERDLQLSTININRVDGVIGITDVGDMLHVGDENGYKDYQSYYEYRTGADNKVRRYTYYIDDHSVKHEVNSTESEIFKPQEGTTLSWTGGISGSREIVTKGYDKDFMFWGLLKFNTTEELIQEIEHEGGTSKITTTTTTVSEGDPLASGSYFKRGNDNAKNFYVTGAKYTTGDTIYSETDVDLDYTSYILGFGKAHYTWTETTPSSTSSTTTIKADEAIKVGFMQDSKGDISIKNAGNIKLAGSLRNASSKDEAGKTAGIGSIKLDAANGSIEGAQAGVYTDKVTARAQEHIYLSQTSIGDKAQISLDAKKGDIVLNSQKGDLEFTGNAGAHEGRYLIKAAGNVATAKNGSDYDAKLIGKRLLIDAENGSVDVRVKTGQSLGSGQFRHDGLDIKAQGDITVYHDEANENLLLGTINSAAGDVKITTSGSLIDAYGESELSDAESKVERWQQMGITSTDDAADSKENSAQAAKARATESAQTPLWRLAAEKSGKTTYNKDDIGEISATVDGYKNAASGLADAVKKYENAMQNADTQAEQEAAKAAFAKAQSDYFAGKGYTASEQQAITNYAQAEYSEGYGWSANSLLYAIEQDVLMSEPGQTVTSKVANITGKNISLQAGSGIGLDAPEVTIAKADMSKLENMQILASAKAGDLTWNSDGSVTVRRQQPILIDAKAGGKVSLAAKDNIYLATINNSALNLTGDVKTDGDLRLMAANGITSDGKLSGRNITLYGGAGSIGASGNLLKISSITGALEANTARVDAAGNKVGVYLESEDKEHVLTLQGVTTGELVLKSASDMAWTQESGKETGYIDADKITLSSKQNIGSENNSIRLLNNGAEVNASANSIYFDAVNKTADAGNALLLNHISAKGNFAITSAGTIKEADAATITANNLQAKAAGDILLANGTNKAENINLSAVGDILLANSTNNASTIALSAAGGIDVKTAGKVGITVAKYGDKLAQSVKLVNGGAEGSTAEDTMTVSGLEAQGDIKVVQQRKAELVINGNVQSAKGDIWLDSAQGLTTTGSSIKADEGNVALLARGGDLNTIANVYAENGYAAFLSKGNITSLGDKAHAETLAYIAKGDIEFDANFDKTKLDASKSIVLLSLDGSIKLHNDANIEAEKNVILQAKNSVQVGGIATGNKGNINAKEGYVRITAETGNIHNVNSITAAKDITLTAENGWLHNAGTINSDGGNISLTAENDWLQNSGEIIGTKDITLTAGKGLLSNTGTIKTTAGNVSLTAENNQLLNSGTIEALKGSINLRAMGSYVDAANQKVLGNIHNTGSIIGKNVMLEATGDIDTSKWLSNTKGIISALGADEGDALSFISHAGNITLDDNALITANRDILVKAYGDVVNNTHHADNKGGLYTAGGDVSLIAETGSVTNNSAIHALAGAVKLQAEQGDITNAGEISASKDVLLTAGKVLNNSSALTSGKESIKLEAGDGLTNNSNLIAGKDVTLTAGGALVNNGQQNFNKIDAKGNISFSGASVENNFALHNAQNVGMNAEDTLANNGSIEVNGNIELKANNLVKNESHLTSAAGNILLTSVNDSVEVGTMLQAKAGNIDIVADKNIKMTASRLDAKKLSLKATQGNADVTVVNPGNTSLIYADEVNVEAGKNVSNVATITAKNISFNAGEMITSSAALSANDGDVIFSAGTAIDNSQSKGINAKGNILFDAATSITSSGALSASDGDVTISAGTTITNTNAITAGKDVTINAKNGELQHNGNITAGAGVILISANASISSTGDIAAKGGALLMNAAKNIISNGDLKAQKQLWLKAQAGTLQADGSMTSNEGNILLNAEKELTVNAGDTSANAHKLSATKGNIWLTSADSSVENKSVLEAKDISLLGKGDVTNAGKIIASSKVSEDGKVIANGDVTMTSQAGKLTNSGEIGAAGDVAITANSGDVENTGAIKADNVKLTVLAANTQLLNEGALTATSGNATLSSAGALTNKGALNAAKNILLTAIGDVVNENSIHATKGNVHLTSLAGAVKNNSGNNTITADAGKVKMTAWKGDVANAGVIKALDDVVLDAVNGNVINSQNITAKAGNITQTAAGKLENTAGTLKSGKNITMQAHEVVNSASLDSAKDIDMKSETMLTNNASVKAGNDVLLQAKTTLTNSGTVAADKNITMQADTLTNKGELTSSAGKAGVVHLDAATSLENTKAINGDKVELISSGTLKNSGAITSADALLLQAQNALQNTNANLQATNGKLELISATESITTSGALSGANINIKAAKKINSNGALTAKDNIAIEAGEDIDNKGTLDAKVINITADGDVHSEGAIGNVTSGEVININAKGNIDSSGAMTANDIRLVAGNCLKSDGDLTAKAGSVDVRAESGAVELSGNINAAEDVTLRAKNGDLTHNGGYINAKNGDVLLQSDTGSIKNSGSIVGQSITLDAWNDIIDSALGQRDENPDAQEGGNKYVLVAKDEKGTLLVRSRHGDITINDGGIFLAKGALELEAKNNIVNNANLNAAGNLLVNSSAGNIDSSGKLHSGSRLELVSDNGSITNNGVLSAKRGLELKAQGDINNTGESVEGAYVSIISTTGNVKNSAQVTSEQNLTVVAQKDITNTGALKSQDGSVSLWAGGNINNEAELNAKEKLMLIARDGAVSSKGAITAGGISITAGNSLTSDGALTAETGSIFTRAESGNVVLSGKLIAQEDVTVYAENGDLKHDGGYINAKAGDVLLQSDTGSISNSGSIVGKSVIVDAYDSIIDTALGGKDDNPDTEGKYVIVGKAADGSVVVRSRHGDITINDDAIFLAKGSLSLEAFGKIANNGQSLNAAGNLQMKSLTDGIENKAILRAGKDITLDAGGKLENNGKLTAKDNIILNALTGIEQNAETEAENNISITNQLNDINLREAVTSVNGSVAIISANGNINAEKLQGMGVYLTAENADKVISVKKTYVANTLGIKGNRAYLYDTVAADSAYGIWQIGDGDELKLKLDTAAERPWDELVLNFNRVNKKLAMDELWVNDITLRIPADELYIERLLATGTADIATNKMHSFVYGRAPQRTAADSIYWNAPHEWMHLYFYSDGRQRSDGALLHLRNYRYVYDQRFAADDWLLYRTLTDEALYRGDISLIPLYERYNLLENEDDSSTSDGQQEAAVTVAL